MFAPAIVRPDRGGRRRLGGIANKRPAAQLAALDRLGDGWALHWFGRPDLVPLGERADLVASGRLVVHGSPGEGDLPAWYNVLDVFCSVEAHAGRCNPAAEGMACGTPLVTTVHGPLALAERAVTALVVPDSPDSALGTVLAEAAEQIASDPVGAARRADAGRARIRTKHWDAYADELLSIVPEAVSERASWAAAAPRRVPAPATAVRIADLAAEHGSLPEDFDAMGYSRLHPDLAALFDHP